MLEIAIAMKDVIDDYQQLTAFRDVKRAAVKAQDPDMQAHALILEHPDPVDKPVEKPVGKSKPDPHANAAAKAAAADRMAKVRAAKAAKALAPKAEPVEAEPEDPVAEKPVFDVSEIIKIRQRTINDLQEAYANGHQKEVFELLSRFGNGAKSFRELTAESFLPIREAIDGGALK
jgi:predicted lipid-binding transport protein (Tim44 family)